MAGRRLGGSVDVGSYGPSGRSLRSRVDRDLARVVNHLIHLGFDLVGAYDLAIDRVDSGDVRDSLQVLRDAHRRGIEDMSERIRVFGVEPTHHGDLHSLVEKARVLVAKRKGDRGILEAMAKNESDMMEAYRAALAQPGLPEEIRVLIESAVAEEGRHRAFYDRALDRFVG